MSISSAYSVFPGHRSRQGHVVKLQGHFLDHAASSLVALSVLFGSMFVAHSTFVRIEGENLLEDLFAVVYTVRGSIASLPLRANAHIASLQLANIDTATRSKLVFGDANIAPTAFSAGEEALYGLNVLANPLIEGMVMPQDTLIYKDLYASIGRTAAEPSQRALSRMGGSMLGVGEFVRDAGNMAVGQLPAASSATLEALAALRDVVVTNYVRGIEMLVKTSYIVAETLVRTAYVIGDKSITVIAIGIPAVKATYNDVIALWVEETNKIAANLLEDQVMLGNRILSVAAAVRNYSSDAQYLTGAAIAEAAQGTGRQFADGAALFTTSSTAALGNFLLLEPAD